MQKISAKTPSFNSPGLVDRFLAFSVVILNALEPSEVQNPKMSCFLALLSSGENEYNQNEEMRVSAMRIVSLECYGLQKQKFTKFHRHVETRVR